MRSGVMAARRSLCVAGALLLGACGVPAAAAPGPLQQGMREDSAAARATIRGVVKDVVSGEPVARALVRLEGAEMIGALTDNEGRFEISGVPMGLQVLRVMKPGFADSAAAGAPGSGIAANGESNSWHNVRVAADMPDLVFTLTPTNAIRGHIDLSTGDPAAGIRVTLLRRAVQDGRAVWQPVTSTMTSSDGAYRFGRLLDGTYAVYTDPVMDSEVPAILVVAGSAKAVKRMGFPTVFYPDARDPAGAAKIHVAGGEQAQADLVLTQEAFHLVRAGLSFPNGENVPADAPVSVTAAVLDPQGHQLPYFGFYDSRTHSVQAFLPDGSYSFLVTAVGLPQAMHFSGRRISFASTSTRGVLVGQADFSVSDQAVTGLRISLGAQAKGVIQVAVIRTGAEQQTSGNTQPSPLVVMLSPADALMNGGMVTSFAEGYATGPIETTTGMNPGPYWVHTTIPQKSLCESSFTAGGVSLAREPLVLSASGATAPLTLTLRDDCATLKLSLPPNVPAPASGDEPFYTVYVVPDFDSTGDVTPITLRPSSGGTFTVGGLTPGSYHVYSLPAQMQIEYRNPEAMASLPYPGQAVTLSPGATASLVVEATQP